MWDLLPRTQGHVHAFECHFALQALPMHLPFQRYTRPFEDLLKKHIESGNAVTDISFDVENPFSYGRLLVDENGQLKAIVEEKIATDEQKKITLINSGSMIIRRDVIDELVNSIDVNQKSGELYLTDVIEIANKKGYGVGYAIPEGVSFMDGINTFEQLKEAQNY